MHHINHNQTLSLTSPYYYYVSFIFKLITNLGEFMSVSSIHHVPNAVLEQLVFRFLDNNDLENASKVCQLWKRCAQKQLEEHRKLEWKKKMEEWKLLDGFVP